MCLSCGPELVGSVFARAPAALNHLAVAAAPPRRRLKELMTVARTKPVRTSSPLSRVRPAPHRPRSWYAGPLPLVATAAAIAVVVIGRLVWSGSGASTAAAPTAAAADALVAGLTHLDPSASLGVGAGSVENPLTSTGESVTRTAGGKTRVTYVGTEYCPFCAAQRWSLLVALSRFGTFSGVRLTQSSSSDIYPNTATFTFTHAQFASSAVDFAPFETQDRDGKPLQQASSDAQASMARYDTGGSIPFTDIGGVDYAVGAGFAMDNLAGKSWQQILAQVKSYQSPIAQAVVGNANWLTAGMCRAGATGDACSDPGIRALVTQLGS